MMRTAREESARQAMVLKQQVMAHITKGAEAARIQAIAFKRAKLLREQAYERALKNALNVEAAVKIQQDAIQQADSMSLEGYLRAETAEKQSNANQWLSF